MGTPISPSAPRLLLQPFGELILDTGRGPSGKGEIKDPPTPDLPGLHRTGRTQGMEDFQTETEAILSFPPPWSEPGSVAAHPPRALQRLPGLQRAQGHFCPHITTPASSLTKPPILRVSVLASAPAQDKLWKTRGPCPGTPSLENGVILGLDTL